MKDIKLDSYGYKGYTMRGLELAYRAGKAVVSDEIWDDLVKKTGYEEQVGQGGDDFSANGRRYVPMNAAHVSLFKTNKKEDLVKFVETNIKEGNPILCEPKLDGFSYYTRYKVNDDGTASLVNKGTTGDGVNALEFFEHALDDVVCRGLAETLSEETVKKFQENDAVIDGYIEIVGECLIDKQAWEASNGVEERVAWRQRCSGISNRKLPSSYMSFQRELTCDEFKLGDRKNPNYKVMAKYGLIKAALEAGFSNDDTVKIYDGVRFFSKDYNPINKFISINGKEFPSKFPTGKLTAAIEVIDFVAYAVSTISGTVDLKLFGEIPEILTFKWVDSLTELTKLDPSEWTRTACFITADDKIEDVIKFFGDFNGNSIWSTSKDLKMWRLNVNNGHYTADGIVLKNGYHDVGTWRNGTIGHNPSPTSRSAFKLPGKIYDIEILDIWDSTTTLGNVTSHAKIAPITTDDGSVVSNLNLFNPDWLAKRPQIKIGAKLKLMLSADLIPVLIDNDFNMI